MEEGGEPLTINTLMGHYWNSNLGATDIALHDERQSPI
jgi:hypothetical protein